MVCTRASRGCCAEKCMQERELETKVEVERERERANARRDPLTNISSRTFGVYLSSTCAAYLASPACSRPLLQRDRKYIEARASVESCQIAAGEQCNARRCAGRAGRGQRSRALLPPTLSFSHSLSISRSL